MADLNRRIAALEKKTIDRRPVTALSTAEIIGCLLRIRLGRKPSADEISDEIACRQSLTTGAIRARLAEIRATRAARCHTT
jgi:hypothetical protein